MFLCFFGIWFFDYATGISAAVAAKERERESMCVLKKGCSFGLWSVRDEKGIEILSGFLKRVTDFKKQ